jgi:Phosphotransferase enzyme family
MPPRRETVLSPHDADLVRRDPALPGLAILLDPEAFVAALRQSLPEANLGTAHITYVRYKPGMNCLVGCQLEVAGAVVEVYAKAHGPDAAVKLRNAHKRPGLPGPLGPGRVVLEDDAIVVCTFPDDRKVKALPCLVDAEARKRLFHQLLPDRPDLWEGAVQRLAYKPERRYVAQILAAHQAVVKVYTKSGYQVVQRKAGALGSHQSLRIAPQLGCSDHHGILVFEWLPGRLLSEAIAASELSLEAVTAVGAALTELHAQTGDRLTQLTREAEAATLLEVAGGLGLVCPPLARQANDLAQPLAAELAQAPLMHRPIHGDFYAKQVLLADAAVAILDLDAAVHGDPAADLGNFIAHLHRDALRGNVAPNLVEPVRDALLEGYRLATGCRLPDRIALYTAVGLLRLAHDPFRHREPHWPERTEALLRRAETILHTLPPRTCSAPYSPNLHPTEERMKS